jgi:hypothetical protein
VHGVHTCGLLVLTPCNPAGSHACQVFERGHFAGVEEMRTNERLFDRVAPMGVNDIAMACQYKFSGAAQLDVPVTSFDGLEDNTIDTGDSLTVFDGFV